MLAALGLAGGWRELEERNWECPSLFGGVFPGSFGWKNPKSSL